jgi:hypothetical protein
MIAAWFACALDMEMPKHTTGYMSGEDVVMGRSAVLV